MILSNCSRKRERVLYDFGFFSSLSIFFFKFHSRVGIWTVIIFPLIIVCDPLYRLRTMPPMRRWRIFISLIKGNEPNRVVTSWTDSILYCLCPLFLIPRPLLVRIIFKLFFADAVNRLQSWFQLVDIHIHSLKLRLFRTRSKQG